MNIFQHLDYMLRLPISLRMKSYSQIKFSSQLFPKCSQKLEVNYISLSKILEAGTPFNQTIYLNINLGQFDSIRCHLYQNKVCRLSQLDHNHSYQIIYFSKSWEGQKQNLWLFFPTFIHEWSLLKEYQYVFDVYTSHIDICNTQS